ncbi:MAG: aspartate--tRNA ligase [Candidatus Woesearchaeota archaeon]|jgi:aspartyl-tRNA synthetase
MYYRTHTCGELRSNDAGKNVTLSGWVHSIRSHGNITFVDLRDRHGRTQIVIDLSKINNIPLKKESVIRIVGNVVKKEQANKALTTGEIEVHVESAQLVNPAEPLPLDENASEETRLKYRYLDIRREEVISKLELRHRVAASAREFLSNNGFMEIETPLLVKSTPEGARDYVVPSRINKGKFYALPQSPQLYKQILMIAGVDRYYQLARCLRDEDLRADRQPEHTQIDLEISFMTSEEIRAFIEQLFRHMFKKTMNIELGEFATFTYKEAMSRFGSDKPDLRFGLELKDITSECKNSSFDTFKTTEISKCLVVDHELTRKDLDELTAIAKVYGAKGLFYTKVAAGKLESGAAKFFSEEQQHELVKQLGAKDKSTVLIISDKRKIVETALGQIRLGIRDKFNLVKKDDFKLVWIVDFPLFSWNEDEQKWDPEHHMFSMPKQEFVSDFEKRPGEVLGDLYDLAMNGVELGSGSIRVSNPELQKRIMNFIGIDEVQANIKFGFLLEAYKYGAPVHGGMGLGLDRFVALLAGTNDIREVIAFPKNKNAECPMDGSPSEIDDKQMSELHLNINKD